MSDTRNGEQPRGEAWERLVEACKAYCLEITPDHIHGKELQEAFSAYEAAQSAEPSDQQATIERLTKERDEARAEADNLRHFEKSYNLAIECVDRAFQVDSTKPPPILPNFVQVGGCKFQAVIRLAEEFAALKTELADERASGGQVNEELKRTIAELEAKLATPEMPEVVKNYMDCTASAFKAWNKSGDLYDQWEKADADVRAYYAPPFKITRPGVYLDSVNAEWRIVDKHKGLWLGYRGRDSLPVWFDGAESCTGGKFTLTKYLRPLE